jgi:heme/copper-type cytochrome/quinol oxidase subunit 2
MEHTPPQTDIRQSVMQRIADGKARMRPAWHFGLLTILWTLGILIVLFTTILLVSFIIFTMRQTGAMSAPAFGLRGLSPLLSAIPWLLVVFSGLGVSVLVASTRCRRCASIVT